MKTIQEIITRYNELENTKANLGRPRTEAEWLETQRLEEEFTNHPDADDTCPVSTGIFLRKAIEAHKDEIPYWRLIDEHHPVVKKLNLDPQEIEYMRNLEGAD